MEFRSTFITVLAWIFIIGSGFALFVSSIQVIMVLTVFNNEELRSAPAQAPALFHFMQRYLEFFIYGFFALSTFTFVSSIGLLKHKNRARLAFIFILLPGIIWQIAGLIV